MQQKYIYVVFSATPYKMGSLIRKTTGQVYNHVSISLSEDFSPMYSFARRYYRTPLYGGFVCESPSRFFVKGKVAQICACKLPITQQQYNTLEAMLTMMLRDSKRYLYNHLSAMGSLVRRPVKAADAYTCVEFCVSILKSLDIDVDPKKYYTTGDLLHMLHRFVVYTGPMHTVEEADSAYYAKKPTPHPVFSTLRDILKLIPRLSK